MKVKLFITFSLALFMVACGGISPELEQTSGTENGHEYVDLGLSVMWAPVNLGASVIGEYGDYYAWGEAEPKDYFSMDNYKHSKGGQHSYTKYCCNASEGTVDNLRTLEPEDDAAHVQWGGEWRMPSKEEWTELRTQCKWTYSRENGKKGWKATGPNGKSIFFPLPGGQHWNENPSINRSGYYRSSSLGSKYSGTTYITILESDDDDDAAVSWSNGSREFGMSIRPICVSVKQE